MLACGVAYAISTQFGARPLYGNPIESPMAQKPNP
jgi:CIC family chloride channel protein